MAENCRQKLGRCGEDWAAQYLREHGFIILTRNYRTRIGELDIVARENRTLCFIEVKTRRGVGYGLPSEAVTAAKQRKLSQMALWYLQAHSRIAGACRFDVVEVVVNRLWELQRIELVRDAFCLSGEYFT